MCGSKRHREILLSGLTQVWRAPPAFAPVADVMQRPAKCVLQTVMRILILTGVTACLAILLWSQGSATSNPETVRLISSIQGPELYKEYCAACHGADGKGGGPMARSLRTSPSDLTRISSRNHGEFPQARIERIISGEELIAAGHGTREMPLWGPIFSQIAWDQDLGRLRINNLARYLKEMQKR
jgi:mono/diheme cytochrome c family protein